MAHISRTEWLAQQAAKQTYTNNGPKVGYFSIKEDKGEAIVRFCYDSLDDFDIVSCHKLEIDGKFRNVNCLRSFKEPIDKCPLCASGVKPAQRFYIKLIEYTRNENGEIIAEPKIWERPTSYIDTLTDIYNEYGALKDMVFKVKRNGEKGSMQTTYQIIPPNQNIYNADLYKIEGNEFEGYDIVGGAVLNKSYEDMIALVDGVPQPAVETIQAPPRQKVTY